MIFEIVNVYDDKRVRLELIKSGDVWYVCRGKHIIALKKSAEDALEFSRLYICMASRFSLKNQFKEVWRWLTLIFS